MVLSLKRIVRLGSESRLPGLVILAALFLCGAVAGTITAAGIRGDARGTLFSFLDGYLALMKSGPSAAARLGRAFLNAFQYHIVVFLAGFTALGVFLVPLVIAARGFFLSFALTAFVYAYGGQGLFLALGALGIQALLSLPCLFFLSFQSFGTAARLWALSAGKAKSDKPLFGLPYWSRFGATAAVLALCALYEAFAAPGVISWIAAQIYT